MMAGLNLTMFQFGSYDSSYASFVFINASGPAMGGALPVQAGGFNTHPAGTAMGAEWR